jgi:SNF2 family DNA or RNA helicase
VVPTPLSRLRFFRLVMDEAQQVQGSTAKAAEMARKIQARHRWAVTGGLQDLWVLLSCAFRVRQ